MGHLKGALSLRPDEGPALKLIKPTPTMAQLLLYSLCYLMIFNKGVFMEMSIVEKMKNFEPSVRKLKASRKGLNKVLIVEDDLALSNLLCEVIETFSPDAEIHMATSGEEAEYHLEKESEQGRPPYDLVVADIFLEGDITGLDIWKTCDLNYHETNILVTSSLPIEKFKSYLKNEDSCPPYLPKPFSLEECMATIHDFA